MKAKDGDREAFNKLAEGILEETRQIIRRCDRTLDEEEIDDLCQEIFFHKFKRAINSYKPSCSFPAFWSKITKNFVTDNARKRKRGQKRTQKILANSSLLYSSSPEEQLLRTEQVEETLASIPRLPKWLQPYILTCILKWLGDAEVPTSPPSNEQDREESSEERKRRARYLYRARRLLRRLLRD